MVREDAAETELQETDLAQVAQTAFERVRRRRPSLPASFGLALRSPDGNKRLLLIDNQAWKEKQLQEAFIKETDRIMSLVQSGQMEDFNGDQTVLNHVLDQDWLPLDKIYNLQVGHDLVAFYSGWNGHFELDQEPLIIHYTTYRKPWNSEISYRYRQLWWDF